MEQSLDEITNTITAAAARYESSPQPYFEYAYKKWKDTALRLLLADRDAVKQCMADVRNEGNAKTLVAVSGSNLGLAKKLDSFNFDFAGQEFAKKLDDDVGLVVSAASDLLDAIEANR